MRLQAVRVPDALDGPQGDPDGLRQGAAGPVVDLTGGSEQVSASTSATVSVEWGGLPGGRVLSRKRPSTPSSA